ncbi:MAG: adenylate/guanylate cyclase domain-containing protein [Candidatus Sericytochromatia bacterium]|nr:adenylate/guanylate cyclase domain-containing protein [Candidatus Sericytochromatia bacterium]
MSLSPQAGSPGRRRWLTLMFADLVDFSSQARQLEAEALLELLHQVFAVLVPPIEAAGGRIDKFLGDGLLACFGDPAGHEDDAERAVGAALSMQRALAISRSWTAGGEPLAMRIGLASGLVVSGPIMAGAREEWTVVGATVHLAKRLESLAPPGCVLVDEATRRLARRRYAFQPQGERPLKGFPVAVPSFRVLGPRAVPATGRVRNEFVGREAELALWQDHLRKVGATATRFAITGPAGIGKSALLDRFHALARRSGSGRIIRPGRGVHRPDEPGAYLAGLWGMLACGLAMPVSRDGELLLRLRAVTPAEPVIWLLDDGHAMDPWSRRLLASWAAGLPVGHLLVVAGRDEGLAEDFSATSVVLSGLADDAAMRLLHLLEHKDGTPPTPSELVRWRRIIGRAGGNPLHLRELWRADAEGRSGMTGLPQSLHGLLQARVDALPESERALARLAAVLGPRWPMGLWEQLLDRDEAEAARLLYERGILRAWSEDELGFADALLQEVLYGQLLAPERRQHHARVAACPAMAGLSPAWRARQVEGAGMPDLARMAWREAASSALSAGAPVEALAFLERGRALEDPAGWTLWLRARLAAGQAMTAGPELVGALALLNGPNPDPDLAVAVVRVFDALGRYDEGMAMLLEVKERLGEGFGGARIEADLAWLAMRLGRLREARRRAAGALRRMSGRPLESSDLDLVARLHHDLAVHERLAGHMGSARRHALKALKLRTMRGDCLGEADAWHNLGTILHARGDLRAAMRALGRGRSLYLESGATRRWLALELNVGAVRLDLGEVSPVLHQAPSWEERAVHEGDRLTAACLALLQAQAVLLLGMPQDAGAHLERAEEILASLGDSAPWAELWRLRGIRSAMSGDLGEAGIQLRRGALLAQSGEDLHQAALLHRALARLAWALGELDEALREAGKAVTWHVRLGTFLEQARSLRLLQEVSREAGRDLPGNVIMAWEPLERIRKSGAVEEARKLESVEGVKAWQP